MHRQHVLGRQFPVHHGENGFLDLAGIFGAGDHDQLLVERQGDRGGGAHAVNVRVGLEIWCVQDNVIGFKIVQRFLRRADEHVAREQRMPRGCGDQPHPHTMGRVRTGIQILDEQFLALQIRLHTGLQHQEFLGCHLLVDLAPPDIGGGCGFIDHELVLHRSPGMHAGIHHHRTVGGKLTLVAAQRFRDQARGGQIGVDRTQGSNTGAAQGISERRDRRGDHGMFGQSKLLLLKRSVGAVWTFPRLFTG